jgi:hypothetical protein
VSRKMKKKKSKNGFCRKNEKNAKKRLYLEQFFQKKHSVISIRAQMLKTVSFGVPPVFNKYEN